jgi:hypothetical protein
MAGTSPPLTTIMVMAARVLSVDVPTDARVIQLASASGLQEPYVCSIILACKYSELSHISSSRRLTGPSAENVTPNDTSIVLFYDITCPGLFPTNFTVPTFNLRAKNSDSATNGQYAEFLGQPAPMPASLLFFGTNPRASAIAYGVFTLGTNGELLTLNDAYTHFVFGGQQGYISPESPTSNTALFAFNTPEIATNTSAGNFPLVCTNQTDTTLSCSATAQGPGYATPKVFSYFSLTSAITGERTAYITSDPQSVSIPTEFTATLASSTA